MGPVEENIKTVYDRRISNYSPDSYSLVTGFPGKTLDATFRPDVNFCARI